MNLADVYLKHIGEKIILYLMLEFQLLVKSVPLPFSSSYTTVNTCWALSAIDVPRCRMDTVTMGREMQTANRDRMAADVGWMWSRWACPCGFSSRRRLPWCHSERWR